MDWLGLSVAAAVAVAAACQVLSGVGFALICSPVLIVSLGHTDGVRVALVMSVLLNIAVLLRSARYARLGDAVRLAIPAVILVLPTLIFSAAVGGATVLTLAGVAILVATCLLASARQLPWLNGPAGSLAAGAASGIMNALAAASGPPVALYAAHRGWSAVVTTATLQAYALPLNLVTLVAVGLPVASTGHLVWAGTGLVIGTAVALPLAQLVSRHLLRTITLLVAAAGGVLLVIRGLS